MLVALLVSFFAVLSRSSHLQLPPLDDALPVIAPSSLSSSQELYSFYLGRFKEGSVPDTAHLLATLEERSAEMSAEEAAAILRAAMAMGEDFLQSFSSTCLRIALVDKISDIPKYSRLGNFPWRKYAAGHAQCAEPGKGVKATGGRKVKIGEMQVKLFNKDAIIGKPFAHRPAEGRSKRVSGEPLLSRRRQTEGSGASRQFATETTITQMRPGTQNRDRKHALFYFVAKLNKTSKTLGIKKIHPRNKMRFDLSTSGPSTV